MISVDEDTPAKKDNKSYEVKRKSQEWMYVEFHLKSSIPSELDISKMVSVKNSSTFNQFETLAHKKLWSYAWYNMKGEDHETRMKEMREKTFDIPKIGMKFRVGSIFDQTNSSEVDSIYAFCKIIIGRAFCQLKENDKDIEEPLDRDNPPYDSFMACVPDLIAISEKMSWSFTQPYSYYIRRRDYIEPLYVVFFTRVNSFLTNIRSKYMCFKCMIHEADVYCPECEHYYCNECQNLVHSGNSPDNRIQNTVKHQEAVRITQKNRPGICSNHPNKESEYYCYNCTKAICGYCQYKGFHNKGAYLQHKSDDIYTAYKKTVDQNYNKEFEEKKRVGTRALKKIREQINTIKINTEKSKDEINKEFNKKKEEMENAAKEAKNLVENYIEKLKEIGENLTTTRFYFKKDNQRAQEAKNIAQLALNWAIYKEKIEKLLKDTEELKKKDFTKLIQLKGSYPSVKINNVDLNENQIIQKKEEKAIQEGFEERQKDENYNILERTRRLLAEIRKKKNEENNE